MRPPEPTDYPRPAGAAPTVGLTCPRALEPRSVAAAPSPAATIHHPAPCRVAPPRRVATDACRSERVRLQTDSLRPRHPGSWPVRLYTEDSPTQGRPQGIDLLCLCIPLVTRRAPPPTHLPLCENATSTAVHIAPAPPGSQCFGGVLLKSWGSAHSATVRPAPARLIPKRRLIANETRQLRTGHTQHAGDAPAWESIRLWPRRSLAVAAMPIPVRPARDQGRRWSNSDGRPAGTSGGNTTRQRTARATCPAVARAGR